MTHHVIVEVPFDGPPMLPIALCAQNATDAVDEAVIRHTNSGFERTHLYSIAGNGEFVHLNTWVREHMCRYCHEEVDRRDGEVVTRFGNDPQCDESPDNNHRMK